MAVNLIIRKCEAEDKLAFIKLNLDFMKETMEENPYWKSLKIPTEEEMECVFGAALNMPERITIFVCEVDGEVVGYANTWTVYSIWSRGRVLTIDDLYIAALYRRNGFGEKLMAYLLEYAEQKGYRRVQLHAELTNERAHGLYRKLGFAEEELMFFMKQIESRDA